MRSAWIVLGLGLLACSSEQARQESTAPPPTPTLSGAASPADAAVAAAMPAPDAAAAVATPTTPVTPATPTTPVTPEPAGGGGDKPKNITELPAAWTTAQVKDYMKKEVAPALGVKCDHCHDKGNFAADHPKKRVAAEMIHMVNEVNKIMFKGKHRVTCNTCHLGKLKPPE